MPETVMPVEIDRPVALTLPCANTLPETATSNPAFSAIFWLLSREAAEIEPAVAVRLRSPVLLAAPAIAILPEVAESVAAPLPAVTLP
ncbi:hypothetical protein, partial [Rhizobium rhizogenes]|uniref:hypothetical protein n=1 Tax=Rhizobium rhizogenes TaxID=359 RepID=UPI001AED14B9